jgi:RNA polymerase sigma-70 factor, ECF subfamily
LERLRLQPDDASWKRFVDLYGPLLLRWLQRQRVLPQDADDLVQEVLAVVVRELPAFRHNQRPGAFRAWLRAILINRLRGYWRNRRSQPSCGESVQQELERLEDPQDALRLLEEQEYELDVLRRLMELIRGEFEELTWQAFRRVTLQQQPAAVAAQELGLTVNAVWLAKSHVLRRLREESRGLLDSG